MSWRCLASTLTPGVSKLFHHQPFYFYFKFGKSKTLQYVFQVYPMLRKHASDGWRWLGLRVAKSVQERPRKKYNQNSYPLHDALDKNINLSIADEDKTGSLEPNNGTAGEERRFD